MGIHLTGRLQNPDKKTIANSDIYAITVLRYVRL
jgi:hypothetical protein